MIRFDDGEAEVADRSEAGGSSGRPFMAKNSSSVERIVSTSCGNVFRCVFLRV